MLLTLYWMVSDLGYLILIYIYGLYSIIDKLQLMIWLNMLLFQEVMQFFLELRHTEVYILLKLLELLIEFVLR